MKKVRRVGFALLAGVLLIGAACNQGSKYTNDPNSQMVGGPKHSTESKNPNNPENENRSSLVSPDEEQFLKHAAESGLAEVELGKLAQEKGGEAAMKQFGQRMVQDHTKANNDLKTLAESKHVQVPDTLNSQDQQMKDDLSKLAGKQFDQRYAQAMVQDHQQAVSDFEKESNSAQDQDVKKFAASTLPILREHLQSAHQLQKNEGGGGR